MDSLRETLFESPFYAYLLLAIVGIALAAIWYARRQTVWLVLLGVVVVLGGVVFVVERTVVTDREQILEVLHEIAGAVERHDLPAAGQYFDDNFRGWMGTKARALVIAQDVCEAHGVRSVSLFGKTEVRFTRPGRAECRVRTLVLFGKSTPPDGRTLIAWETDWIKRDAGWRVRYAKPSAEAFR
jgi:hypothetical protein